MWFFKYLFRYKPIPVLDPVITPGRKTLSIAITKRTLLVESTVRTLEVVK